jgi:hypothetical protein
MLQILKAPEFIGSVIVGLVVLGTFVYIKNLGRAEVEREILEEVVRKENAITELEKEVIRLERPDLVTRYCKWLRDASQAECVQTHLSEYRG